MKQTNAPALKSTHRTPAARLLAILILGAVMVTAGCEEKKSKPFKTAKTRRAKREVVDKKEAAEKTDPIDRAWNTPPTEGMGKLRLALHGKKGLIKGRPEFMAPQFELIAVELLERIHEEGFRATDRKTSVKINPNEHGRYVWELKPGHWKVYVTPLDDLWEPWISDPINLEKGESKSIDVQLVPANKRAR